MVLKLFIDDLREVCDIYPCSMAKDFIIVRDYSSAVSFMNTFGCPQYVSFDHDLGEQVGESGEELNGFRIAQWMVNNDLDLNGTFIPNDFGFLVHSANPIGKINITGLLNNYLEFRNGY